MVSHSAGVKSVFVAIASLAFLCDRGRVTAPDVHRASAQPSRDVLRGRHPDRLPGEDQIGVLHAFPIGVKNTWICVGIALEVLRNLRKRLALLDEVILDLLLVLGVLQLCNLNLAHPLDSPHHSHRLLHHFGRGCLAARAPVPD